MLNDTFAGASRAVAKEDQVAWEAVCGGAIQCCLCADHEPEAELNLLGFQDFIGDLPISISYTREREFGEFELVWRSGLTTPLGFLAPPFCRAVLASRSIACDWSFGVDAEIRTFRVKVLLSI